MENNVEEKMENTMVESKIFSTTSVLTLSAIILLTGIGYGFNANAENKGFLERFKENIDLNVKKMSEGNVEFAAPEYSFNFNGKEATILVNDVKPHLCKDVINIATNDGKRGVIKVDDKVIEYKNIVGACKNEKNNISVIFQDVKPVETEDKKV